MFTTHLKAAFISDIYSNIQLLHLRKGLSSQHITKSDISTKKYRETNVVVINEIHCSLNEELK